MEDKKILITSALPYANGPIHIGHMIEYVQTDVYQRFLKLIGKKAIYCCADDTHGTPIEINAKKNGKTPEEFIKHWYKGHTTTFKTYDIGFDSYYTTNSEESKHYTELIFKRLQKKGYIYTKDMELTYCEHDKRFLPDRYVKGKCPKCGSEDQYGDVCEKCNATYDTTDLKDPYCALCGNTPVRKMSKHYFFKLSEFSDFLREWLSNKRLQPEIRNQIMSWVDGGLEDWCISRDGPYFGFKIPGEDDKYFYVWLDAPIGYIASTANYCKDKDFTADDVWQGEMGEIVHFIGKDIIYFHLLFWPAVLKAADFNVPSNIIVHGFLTVNKEKMSKSRGTFIMADDFAKICDPQYLRYYFSANLTHTMTDIDLDFDNITKRINGELVGNIANFVYRVLSFTNKFFDSSITKVADKELLTDIRKRAENVKKDYESFEYRSAVKRILEISDLGNRYFQKSAPWKLVKEDKNKASAVITDCVNIAKYLTILVKPILPSYSEAVEKQLGVSDLKWSDLESVIEDAKIGKAEIVLNRVDKITIGENKKKTVKEKPKEEVNPFSRLNLKVAKIKKVSDHYKADKLLVVQIDLGSEKRQLVAGLKPYYPDSSVLEGKKIIVVTNLEHANLRGEMSQGMLLAAETKDGKTVEILEAPNSEPGDQVFIEGIEPGTETIKFDQFLKVKMKVTDYGVKHGEKELKTKKDVIRTQSVENGYIR